MSIEDRIEQRKMAAIRAIAFLRMLVREELLPVAERPLAQEILDAFDYPTGAV